MACSFVDDTRREPLASDSRMTLGHLPNKVQAALDAKGLANLFLDWADQESLPLSNLKLQKLLFFSHADYVVSSGSPLIKEVFQAWDHGPVLPTVYREFKGCGAEPITIRATKFDPLTARSSQARVSLDDAITRSLRSAYNFYKRIGAFTLSGLSHSDGGPWRHARELFDKGLNPERQIGIELIRRYHQRIGV